jgi:hypothetical protein
VKTNPTTSLPSAFIEYITHCRVVSELLQRTVISGRVDTKAIRPLWKPNGIEILSWALLLFLVALA